MKRAALWFIACCAGVLTFALAWWICDRQLHLETSWTQTLAGFAAAIIMAPLGFLAERSPRRADRPSDPAPPALALGTAARVIVGSVPRSAAALQPRQPLLDRLARLRSSREPAVVCAVTGARGVGKTQLAAAYARSCLAAGWPVVVWLTATDEDEIISGLAEVADQAGVRTSKTTSQVAARAALHWLQAHVGPALIVFDNVNDVQVAARWLPTIGNVQVVITAVRHSVGDLGEAVPVDLFTESEAAIYLQERTRLNDPAGAAKVAEQLGRLPLALASAAAVIGPDRPHPTYQKYLARLAEVSVSQALLQVIEDPYLQQRGASQALQLSIDDLDRADGQGLARRLLNLLAVLSSAGVSVDVLTSAAQASTGRRRWFRLRRVKPISSSDVDTALALLADRSIVIRTTDTNMVTAHRLIQRVVREFLLRDEQLDGVVKLAATVLEGMLIPLAKSWSQRADGEQLLTQIQALWDAASGTDSDGSTDRKVDPKQNGVQPDSVRRLLKLRAWGVGYLDKTFDPGRATVLGEVVMADCLRLLGADHAQTHVSQASLANAYSSAGYLNKAIALFAVAIDGHTKVFGPQHEETLRCRADLSDTYAAAGRLAEAIQTCREVLDARMELLGADHPDTLASRRRLARWLGEAGDAEAAAQALERVVADRLRLLDADDPDTLDARFGLAFWRRQAEQSSDPAPFNLLLDDYIRILGPDHPDTLNTRHNLAGIRGDSGDAEGAVRDLEALLTDYLRVLGPDHPDTLSLRSALAHWRGQAGDGEGALSDFERLVADRLRVLGPDHPDTLVAREHVAHWRGMFGTASEAAAQLRGVLDDRLRLLGPDHPETLGVRHRLAHWIGQAGQPAEAVAALEQLLQDRVRVLGVDHPDTLNVRSTLAQWLGESGDLPASVAAFKRLYADLDRVYGPTHVDTVSGRTDLINALVDLGLDYFEKSYLSTAAPGQGGTTVHNDSNENLDRALAAFQEALGIIDRQSEPATYGVVLHDIAAVYQARGMGPEALSNFYDAMACKRLGDNPTDLVTTMLALGGCLTDQGEDDKARAIVDEAKGILIEKGGQVDPAALASSFHALGRAYEALGADGEPDAAIEAVTAYRAALTLLDPEDQPLSYATVLRDIGDILRDQGELNEALTAYEGAARLLRPQPEGKRLLANVLISLGRTQRQLGLEASAETP